MSDFKPGDVVRLKGGGQPMTVRGPSETAGELICEWMMRRGKKQSASFIREQLEFDHRSSPVEPPKGSAGPINYPRRPLAQPNSAPRSLPNAAQSL